MDRMDPDALMIPFVHERLGILYDGRGQRGEALRHLQAFLELWKDGDVALRGRVEAVRGRAARPSG
jgi:hypothetical protein